VFTANSAQVLLSLLEQFSVTLQVDHYIAQERAQPAPVCIGGVAASRRAA